jgi:hypothetical protein
VQCATVRQEGLEGLWQGCGRNLGDRDSGLSEPDARIQTAELMPEPLPHRPVPKPGCRIVERLDTSRWLAHRRQDRCHRKPDRLNHARALRHAGESVEMRGALHLRLKRVCVRMVHRQTPAGEQVAIQVLPVAARK